MFSCFPPTFPSPLRNEAFFLLQIYFEKLNLAQHPRPAEVLTSLQFLSLLHRCLPEDWSHQDGPPEQLLESVTAGITAPDAGAAAEPSGTRHKPFKAGETCTASVPHKEEAQSEFISHFSFLLLACNLFSTFPFFFFFLSPTELEIHFH